MKLNVYVRRVLGSSLPAAIWPDGVDIYLQLDVHEGHVLFDKSLWFAQTVECESNVIINGASKSTALRVANPFKGVYDAVWCTKNGEVDNDHHSLEDGRSRRYFVSSGKFWAMVSLPILKSYLPVSFSRLGKRDEFGLCRMQMIRAFRSNQKIVELLITIVFGKNICDYAIYSVDDYKKSISEVMFMSDRAVSSSRNWKGSDYLKEWLVVIAKDHSARIDAIDVDSFLSKYGRDWRMPLKSESYSDPIRMAGCLDITGWKSSIDNLRYDIMLQGYDDHSPSLLTFILPFDELLDGGEQRLLKKYYIKSKWSTESSYLTHDGRTTTEDEYQDWRRKHGVRW